MNILPSFMTACFSLSLLSVSFIPSQAQSITSPKCGTRSELVEILKDRFNQKPAGLGLSYEGREAFEIYTSEDGDWTVMMTKPNGQTCIMAGGHSWKNYPRKVSIPGIAT